MLQKDKAISRVFELQANRPVAQVARLLPYREHVVRYHMQRLERDTGMRPVPIIDFARLGYLPYSLYFTLAPGLQLLPASLTAPVSSFAKGGALIELSGEYEYELRFWVRAGGDRLLTLIEAILQATGNAIRNKQVVLRQREVIFGRKYLAAGIEISPLKYGDAGIESCLMDVTDEELLTFLLTHSYKNVRNLALQFGMSEGTMLYRLRRLEKAGIIAGWIYRLPPAFFGATLTRVLISLGSLNSDLQAGLLSYSKRHPYVVALRRTAGQWDYELDVECKNPSTVSELRREVSKLLGAALYRLDALTILEDGRVQTRSFEALRAAPDTKSGSESRKKVACGGY